MIDPTFAQVRGTPFKPTTTLSGSEHVFLVMIAVIALAILAWVMWMMWGLWRQRVEGRQRWDELAALSRRAGLSREEYAFLFRVFRRGKVENPMSVMRDEEVYESFFAHQIEWAGRHTELLVKSIQRKVFGTSLGTDRPI